MSTTTIGHFIAGHVEPGTGERTGPVYNPSTGEEIARCDYANRALLDRAVAVATEAGKKWGRASHAARQAVSPPAPRPNPVQRLYAWLFGAGSRTRWSVAVAGLAVVGIGLNVSLAAAELLTAHKNAVTLRVAALKEQA